MTSLARVGFAFLAAAILVLLFAYHPPQTHSQGVGTPITGTAWSDYMGWIKLDCTTAPNDCAGHVYGLAADSGGVITGYAWGDNPTGWVSAYGADTSVCGAGGAYLQGSLVKGWLRELNIPGSDGCVKLDPGGSQDVTFSAGVISGNAWGGDVIGWLQFNGQASLVSPTCGMNASPPLLYAQALPPSMLLTYNTQNTASSSIDHGVGSVDPNGTSVTITPPSVTTTYTMTVNSGGVQGTCQTVVTVQSGYPPPVGCISVNANNPSCTAPVVKSGRVHKNGAATLYWSVSYITSNTCSVTKNGAGWLSGQTASNTTGVSTGALAAQTEYVLSCTAQDGSTFTDRAVINIVPEYIEI